MSAALCAGDTDMFERWMAALSSAATAGVLTVDLGVAFAQLVKYCDIEPF